MQVLNFLYFRENKTLTMGLFLILFGALFYFLPSIVGFSKDNFVSIFVLNLLLGWTVIGWIVALVWGLAKDSKPIIINNSETSQADEINKIKKLYDDGVIGKDEFEEMKKKSFK
jgi:hypothetical protein